YTASWKKLRWEIALSRNAWHFRFKERYPTAETGFSNRYFDPQWMPKIAMTYQPLQQLLLRTAVSRGYSPPTTAEIRPAGNRINTRLEAGHGWNYEAGLRYRSASSRLTADLTAYYFRMQ